MGIGAPTYFPNRPQPGNRGATREECSTACNGCFGPGLLGETCQRCLAPGKWPGGCSIKGMPTGRSPRFCIACKRRLSRRARSTSSCSASTARRCRRRAPGGGNNRPRGASRPRIRPFPWGFNHENPYHWGRDDRSLVAHQAQCPNKCASRKLLSTRC